MNKLNNNPAFQSILEIAPEMPELKNENVNFTLNLVGIILPTLVMLASQILMYKIMEQIKAEIFDRLFIPPNQQQTDSMLHAENINSES